MNILQVGTLFSGIGAPEAALTALGTPFVSSFACEINPYSRKTFEANHVCDRFYEDVTTITDAPQTDVMAFGFPCQLFSTARATRSGHESNIRFDLLRSALRVVRQSRPKYFIAENVKGLANDPEALDKVLRMMRSCGYRVQYKVLNSLDFGVPQHRERIWFIATRSDLPVTFSFPEFHSRKYIPLQSILDNGVGEPYLVDRKRLVALRKPAMTRIERYSKDYTGCLTETVGRRGSSSEYLSYIAAVYNAIGVLRNLTPRECARLNGFSDDFEMPVSDTQAYKQQANTMTVNVLVELFKRLLS